MRSTSHPMPTHSSLSSSSARDANLAGSPLPWGTLGPRDGHLVPPGLPGSVEPGVWLRAIGPSIPQFALTERCETIMSHSSLLKSCGSAPHSARILDGVSLKKKTTFGPKGPGLSNRRHKPSILPFAHVMAESPVWFECLTLKRKDFGPETLKSPDQRGRWQGLGLHQHKRDLRKVETWTSCRQY